MKLQRCRRFTLFVLGLGLSILLVQPALAQISTEIDEGKICPETCPVVSEESSKVASPVSELSEGGLVALMLFVFLAGVALLFAGRVKEADGHSIAWPRGTQAVGRWVV